MRHATLIFLICISFISQQLQAQNDGVEWAPLGATWHYEVRYPFSPVVNCLAMEVIKDTIIDGITARFIEGKLYQFEKDTIPATDVYDQGNIILHQKGDSIYYYRENKFELLYDFSLEVGDTMDIVTPAPYDLNYVSDTMIQMVVDSVGEVVVGNDTLRKQVFRMLRKFDSNYGFGGTHIEKIGNLYFLLPVDDLLCDVFCPLPLRCYQDSSLFYKQWEVDCDATYLMTSTQNNISLPEIHLYPNPIFSGSSQFYIEGPDRFTWRLRDIHGRTLYYSTRESSGKETAALPSGLSPGLYLVEIRTGERTYVRKLVVN